MVKGVVRPGEEDAIALQDTRQRLTRVELDGLLDRAVNGLSRLDLGAEPRVAVYAANCVEVTIAHLAGMFAGVSTVPISASLQEDEVRYVLEDSGAGALLVGPETVALGASAARRAGVTHVLAWRSSPTGDAASWEQWLDTQSTVPPPMDIPAARVLFYTSGTTGHPKGTSSRLLAPLEDVSDLVDQWVRGADDGTGRNRRPSLVVGPMHHISPLLSSVEAVFSGGAVILDRFDARAALEAIDRHGVGSMAVVPTHLSRLLALPPEVRDRYDVASLSWVGLTGAGCPVHVKRAIIDWFGPVVIEAYGATEAGAVCLIGSEEWLQHPGSVGRCVPAFEVVVVDEDGVEVDAGETGRLFFRDLTGQGIAYRNATEKTAAAHLAPAVFTLGDVGRVDADGYVYITDRAVDMIVSGGVNIYPAEAERVLIAHPGVRDVALIGIPHADLGESVHALVEPVDAANAPAATALIAHCREHLAHYKCPTSIEFVDSVERSPMGKLNKRELRAPYWPTDRTIAG